MSPFRNLALGIGAALALGGCTGYDSGYRYGGVSLGVGSAGYYDPFYDSPYYGAWSGNYYYPGTGYSVYDRRGNRSRWTDGQRRYFEGRQYTLRDREDVRDYRQFRREGRQDRRAFNRERREDRAALRSGAITREQFRQDRRADREAYRGDRRADRREFRRDLRDSRPRRRP